MTQKPITWLSFHFGSDPEGSIFAVAVRVVPTGKEGNTVLGKSLNHGEPDDDQGILLLPGERALFPAGSIKVTMRDVDRENTPGPDGYASLANTIWTWFQIPPHPDAQVFHYLFAMARRLDTAYDLCASVINLLNEQLSISSLPGRAQSFQAWGQAELMCVALYRAIKMIRDFPAEFSSSVVVPKIMEAIFPALEEIRNSFEHIEDRAMGQVRSKPHQDALSIFNQDALLTSGVLRYANHSLDLRKEVIPALIAGRQQVFDIAVEKSGPAKVNNQPTEIGPLPEQPVAS